jgi:hypothetical protein
MQKEGDEEHEMSPLFDCSGDFPGASRCATGDAASQDSFFFIDEGKFLFDRAIGKTRNTDAGRSRPQAHTVE